MDRISPGKRLLAVSALVAPILWLAAPITSDSRPGKGRSGTGVWGTEQQSPFVIR